MVREPIIRDKLQSETMKKISALIESNDKEMIRLKDCQSGDVIEYSSLSCMPLYIHKEKKYILVLTISLSEDEVEVRWNNSRGYRYGLNCQMWVNRKILKPKNNQ